MLPVRPENIHWIQFWCVGWQELQPNAPSLLADCECCQEIGESRNSTRSRPPSLTRSPIEVVLQNRRLATGSPRTAAMWALTQSALVDEDDRTAFFLNLFLISGQRFCFHNRIFPSSHSKALHRTLAAPPQLPQNAPCLRSMIANPSFLLDEVRHAP